MADIPEGAAVIVTMEIKKVKGGEEGVDFKRFKPKPTAGKKENEDTVKLVAEMQKRVADAQAEVAKSEKQEL